MKHHAKETVENFIAAINNEDFDKARSYVFMDMKFVGVLGSRDGSDAYFNDMKKMRFKYEVKKIFSDENDVCVFYNINMNEQIIFTCGWYKTADGKIKSIRVLFDPRPILEASKKK